LEEEMIQVGTKAPVFEVEDNDGQKIDLSDLTGTGTVFYFYPKDDTPGCTIEAQDFTRLLSEFENLGYKVFGVSKDSVASHQKFIKKCDLGIPLLSDTQGTMVEAYGAWGEKKNYGKIYQGIIRSTVVTDSDGNIIKHYPNVRAKGHAERVLDDLKDL
jgi:peroxiredoxin Q/BCP